MAQRAWHTISTRIDDSTKHAVETHCRRLQTQTKKKITSSKLVSNLIEKEIKYLKDPSALPSNQGLPLVGKHHIEYDLESDSFCWKITAGSNIHILAKNLPSSFMDGLYMEIQKGLTTRNREKEKLQEGKFFSPETFVKKFEVDE